MTKQRGKIADGRAQMERLPTFWRKRFTYKERNHHRDQQARYRQDPEDHMPAKPNQHRAADHRGKQRRNGGHQHDKRHHPRKLFARINIAHQGINHHAGCGCRETMKEAHGNQLIDTLCQRAGHGRRGENQRTAKNNRLTPDAVRHRAIKQLPQRKAQNVGA